jgi:uncharacterized damage-inducible protein DinB
MARVSDSSLLRAVRHSCWANEELIEFCGRLSPEQLSWTVSGTYGSIQQTLQHIVGAELGYLFALTREAPVGGPLRPDALVSLGELATRERSVAERCEHVLSGSFDPARVVSRPNRPDATAGVVIAQLVHHGSDHRAQVATILGAHGLEPPDIDVWAYGRSIGEVGEIAVPRPSA